MTKQNDHPTRRPVATVKNDINARLKAGSPTSYTSTPVPPQKPTIKSLNASITDLRSKLVAFQVELDELRRKSRGTETANARLTVVEKQVAGLITEIGQTEKRKETLANVGDISEPQLGHLTHALNRLNARFEATQTDVYGQLTLLSNQLGRHDDTLRFHGEQIAKTQDGLDDVKAATIDVGDAKVNKTTPWVVALVAGVIGYIIAVLVIPTFMDGSDWQAWHVRNNIASVIVGIAVFLFVSSFEEFSINLSAKLKFPERKDEPVEAIVVKSPEPSPQPAVFDQDDGTKLYTSEDLARVASESRKKGVSA